MSARANWRRWRVGRTGPAELLALVFLGLFMTSVDAFNVQTEDLPLRLVYWLTTIVGGGMIGALIEPVLERAALLRARPRIRAAAQILVMTFPITILVWVVSGLMAVSRLNLHDLVGYFPGVLIVDIVVVALGGFCAWRPDQPRRWLRPLTLIRWPIIWSRSWRALP